MGPISGGGGSSGDDNVDEDGTERIRADDNSDDHMLRRKSHRSDALPQESWEEFARFLTGVMVVSIDGESDKVEYFVRIGGPFWEPVLAKSIRRMMLDWCATADIAVGDKRTSRCGSLCHKFVAETIRRIDTAFGWDLVEFFRDDDFGKTLVDKNTVPIMYYSDGFYDVVKKTFTEYSAAPPTLRIKKSSNILFEGDFDKRLLL